MAYACKGKRPLISKQTENVFFTRIDETSSSPVPLSVEQVINGFVNITSAAPTPLVIELPTLEQFETFGAGVPCFLSANEAIDEFSGRVTTFSFVVKNRSGNDVMVQSPGPEPNVFAEPSTIPAQTTVTYVGYRCADGPSVFWLLEFTSIQ